MDIRFPGPGHFDTAEKRRQMGVYIVVLVVLVVGIHWALHMHEEHRLSGSPAKNVMLVGSASR